MHRKLPYQPLVRLPDQFPICMYAVQTQVSFEILPERVGHPKPPSGSQPIEVFKQNASVFSTHHLLNRISKHSGYFTNLLPTLFSNHSDQPPSTSRESLGSGDLAETKHTLLAGTKLGPQHKNLYKKQGEKNAVSFLSKPGKSGKNGQTTVSQCQNHRGFRWFWNFEVKTKATHGSKPNPWNPKTGTFEVQSHVFFLKQKLPAIHTCICTSVKKHI